MKSLYSLVSRVESASNVKLSESLAPNPTENLLKKFILRTAGVVALFLFLGGGVKGQVTIWSDNFDASTTSWTVAGNFAVGAPGVNNVVIAPRSSAKILATVIDGKYANYCTEAANYAISPVINCSSYSSVSLNYYSYSIFETCCDYGRVYYSIDNGATWLASIEQVGSTVESAYTLHTISLPNASFASQVKIRFTMYSDGSTTRTGWNIDDLSVVGTSASVCSGTPAPGNTTSTAASVSPGGTVTLGLQNATTGTGVTYQWESSTTSSSSGYSNISGATSSTYTATVTANTWYRCKVTCSSNTGTSSATQVTLTYCTPTSSSITTYFSNFVTSGGSTNISNATTAASGGYINYSATVSASQYATGVLGFSATIVGGTAGIAIFVDWNNDLDFADAGETMYTSNAYMATGTTTSSFTIPAGTANGNYRMRIVTNYSSTNPAACSLAITGETEDYTVTVITAPACSGTPSPGNTIASSASVATGSTVNLSLQTATSGTGLTYQWQSGPSSTGPWTNFGTSASTQTSPTLTSSSWFRCNVTCGANTGTSAPVQVSIIAISGLSVSTACPGSQVTATGNFPSITGVTVNSQTAVLFSQSSGSVTFFVPNTTSGNVVLTYSGGTVSTPLTIAPAPKGILTGTQSVCSGSSAQLTFNSVSGTGPFSLTYLPSGGSNVTLTNITNGSTISVSPITNTTYEIISLVDANGCTWDGNLVVNPDAKMFTNGWTLDAIGGSGWATFTDVTCFGTSYSTCLKSQVIDLATLGYSTPELNAQPEIYFSDSYTNYGTTDKYGVRVELQSTSNAAVSSFANPATFATFGTLSYINPSTAYPAWSNTQNTFNSYGTSVSKIKIQNGGYDGEFWVGYYGIMLKGTTLKVKPRVTVLSLPTASVTANAFSCTNLTASFSLTGTSGANVSYSINNGTTQTVTLTGGTATSSVSGVSTNQTLTLISVTNPSTNCVASLNASATVTITAPACASSLLPANNATNQSANGIVLSWASVTCATGYDVYVNDVLVSLNQAGLTHTTGSLTESSSYTWKVVPRNGTVYASGCSTLNFTTSAACAPPTFTKESTNVSCFGQSTGSITISASGGQSPLYYSIDGGITYSLSNVFTPLSAGTYSVVVKGADNCLAAAQAVTISQPTAVLAVTASGGGSGCGGSTLSLSSNVTGGTIPYSYSWTNAAGLSSATVANPTATIGSNTLHTLTVTDANGCTGSSSVTITNNSPAAPTVVTPAAICQGQSANLNATSSGNSINWYTTSSGGSAIASLVSSGANYSVSPLTTATYYAEAVIATPGSQPFSYTGSIVNWTVPAGVSSITVNAKGASGGYYTGATAGKGANMTGTFSVTPGQVLSILVGQSPGSTTLFAAGGGGTFVALGSSYTTATPLIVAGGGGGAYSGTGTDAPTTASGTGSLGGTNGNGATQANCTGGGGGFYTSGANDLNYGFFGGAGFRQGGAGGTATSSYATLYQPGGFGGGSAANYIGTCNTKAGNGGGYSGGGGQGISTVNVGNAGGSFNGGNSQNNIAGNNVGNGSVTITYSSVGCASVRAPVTVIVNPTSVAGTASSDQTICSGATPAALTLSGNTGTIQWQSSTTSSSSGFTNIANQTNATLTLGALNTTTYYRAVVTSGVCSSINSNTVTITVNQPSVAPTSLSASTATICNGGSTTLTQTGGSLGTGAVWQWYSDANFTTAVGATQTSAAASLSVSPTTTTTYYLRAINGTSPCAASVPATTPSTVSVTVTVNQPSVAPTSLSASTATICNGGSTTLTQNGGSLGTGAVWQWYSDANFTTAVGATQTSAAASLSVSPTTTSTYYLRAINGTSPCAASVPATTPSTVSVTVTVNQPSVAPTSISGTTTICNGASTTLTAVGATLGTGASYEWGTGSTVGTSPIAGTGSSITVSPTATTSYWVRLTGTSPCATTTDGVTTSVTVNALPTAVTVSGGGAICAGSSATLTADNGGSGTIYWQNTTSGGTSTTTASASQSVSAAGTYYFRPQSAEGCWGTEGSATVTVTSLPSTPTVTVVNNCNGTSTLSTTATGTLLWSNSETTSPITVSTAGTYTVTQTANGCTSASGSGVAAPKTTPVTPSVSVTNACGLSTLSFTPAANATILWSDGGTSSSTTTSSNTTLTVVQTVNGCPSSAGSGSAVPLVIPSAPTATAAQSFCVTDNATVASLAYTNVAGNTYTWYDAATAGNIVATSTQLPTAITSYYLSVSGSNGCTSLTRTLVAATESAQALATVSIIGTSACPGGEITFTATPSNGGNSPTYQWYNGGVPILNATGNTYIATGLAEGAVITVKMIPSGSCVTVCPN